jgi:hypothetical protein
MMNPTIIAVRPMIYSEAKECVNQINANMTNIRSLVLDLYERKGWDALGYESWRECVTAEFKQSQSYLYFQLEAAQTERNISTIVEKTDSIPESQLRPLAKLRDNPEAQKEAWQKAVETAPEGKVTAAHVARVVKGMTEPEEINGVSPATVKRAGKFAGAVDEVKTQNPDLTDTKKIYQLAKEKTKGMGSVAKKTIPGPGSAIRFAEIAISQLDRIRDGDPETEDALCMVQEWIDNKRKQRS